MSTELIGSIRLVAQSGLSSPRIFFRPAVETDLLEVCKLLNETFGPNPKVKATILDWIENDSFAVFVASKNNEIVGVCAACVKNDLDLKLYSSFGPKAIASLRDRRIGLFLHLAVRPACRRLGIGRKLGEMNLQWLKMRCSIVVGTSWQSGNADNSEHLFQSAGFKSLGESQEYLLEQSRQTGFICAICNGLCRCKATLFALELG